MTNQEAVKHLKEIKKQFHKYDFTEALNVAIKALEDKEEGDTDV